ncbi:hypothetical protein [Streptomyces sp. AK04-3B]|uniref:hypothetical protein n=1 Tax=unclassified Streptomyces TaxID=2593676 RepID=UPI0029A7BD31|nr:hypothetical protein [Streptomyces sp. AK04-3B]MDX3802587.1 hypothetical protein [Streptomyces sp. AK04-3B]
MRPIPADLTEALEDWHTTYRLLAARPCSALRRRLIRLSCDVLSHPYWDGGRSAAARAALFSAGRGGGRGHGSHPGRR